MIDDDQVILRKTVIEDLERFFHFQLDEVATQMAAFSPKDREDKVPYLERYSKYLNDPTKTLRTILVDANIVGSISKFEMHGDAEITYWIERKFWGHGIASAALKSFLVIEKMRPIFGRTAFDNIGSQRVLEKAGFVRVVTDKGFANARQAEIEFVYKLS